MPRGLLNWSYKDVTEFLKDHGFEFKENKKGSHEAWIHNQGHRPQLVSQIEKALG